MKKIILFFVLGSLVHNGLYAQERKDTLLFNFEDQTTGIFTSSGPNVTKEVVTNPFKGGENTSNYVLKISANTSVEAWEALYSTPTLNIYVDGTGEGYRYLHFKVYKSIISNMLWGLYSVNPNDPTKLVEKYPNERANKKINEWEYVVIDLLELGNSWNIAPGIYKKINFNLSKSTSFTAYTGYIDDVYLSNADSRVIAGVTKPSIKKNVNATRIDDNTVEINTPTNVKLDIYNMQGQILHSIKNTNSSSYKIIAPKNSFYILRVSNNNEIYCAKF